MVDCGTRSGSVRDHANRVVAELAAAQDGVVARFQLLARGLGAGAIGRRVRSGLLTPLYAGVYCVGQPFPTPRGRLRAGLLASGPGAVLSHWSAAFVHELLRAIGAVHVTTVSHRESRPGLIVHRARVLPEEEVTEVAGLPCTTVARTLVDLAAVGRRRHLEQAIDQADRLQTYDGRSIAGAMREGRPGSAVLRRVLAEHAPGTTLTRSPLEERFLALCRRAGLPGPMLNVPMVLGDGTPIVVDAMWAGKRVAVELDGRDTHARRLAFERDAHRNAELHSLGWLPLRFTGHQVYAKPAWVLARLSDHVAD